MGLSSYASPDGRDLRIISGENFGVHDERKRAVPRTGQTRLYQRRIISPRRDTMQRDAETGYVTSFSKVGDNVTRCQRDKR